MGNLDKIYLARLIILSTGLGMHLLYSAIYKPLTLIGHFGASIMAFFWPKVFFDFLTKRLDILVSPFPILQVINLLAALIVITLEWPLHSKVQLQPHSVSRLVNLPIISFLSCLIYQGTDIALYYLIGFGIYWWAYNTINEEIMSCLNEGETAI